MDAIGVNINATKMDTIAKQKYKKSWQDLSDTQKEFLLIDTVGQIYKNNGALGQGAREANSLTNVMGNLKASWDRFLSVLGAPVLTVAVGVIQKLTDKVTGLVTNMDSNGIGNFLNGVRNAFNLLSPIIKGIITDITGIASKIFPDLGKSANGLGQTLTYFIANVLNKFKSVLNDIYTWVSQRSPEIKSTISKVIDGSSKAIQFLLPILEDMIDDAIKIGKTILEVINPFKSFSSNADGLGKVLTDVAKGGLTAVRDILDWFANHSGAVQVAVIGISSAFGTWKTIKTTKDIINGVKDSINTAKTAFSTVKGTLDTARLNFMYFQDGILSVSTRISNFKDKALNGLSSALDVTGNKAKSVGNSLSNFGSKVASSVGNGLSKVASLAKSAGSALLDFGKSAAKGAVSVAKMTLELGKQGIAWLAHKLAVIASTVAEKAMAISQAALNLVMSLNPIGLVVIAIAGLVAAFVIAYKNSEKFREILDKAFNAVKEVVIFVVDTVVEKWKAFWTFISDLSNNIKSFLSNVWNTIKSTIVNVVTSLITGIVQKWNDFWRFISNLINNIKTFFINTWTSIKNTVIDVVVGLITTVINKWNDFWRSINNLINNIKNFFINSWNSIKTTVVNIVINLVSTILQKWNEVTNFFRNLPSTMVRLGSDAFNALKNGIWNVISGIGGWIRDRFNDFVNFFKNLPNTMLQAGHDMINSLKQGIQNKINDVVGVAKDLGRKVLEGIKNIFGIHSPSREMFKIGDYLMQGFTNGIKNNNIGNMVKSVFGNVTSIAKGALGKPLGFVLKPLLNSGAFKKIGSTIKGVIDQGASFFGSSGVGGNVTSWLTQAMAITGTDMNFLPALQALVQHESGGNPKSINLWDSNAAAGHPSKGLMQMIDETFNRWKLPGMNDIWNPVNNAVSAIRYMVGRYGSISNVPGIRNLAGGRGYVGYATGTPSATPGWHWVGEQGPELMRFNGGEQVLDNSTSKKLTQNSSMEETNSLLRQLVDAIRQGSTIQIDGKNIATATYPYISNKMAIHTKRR